MCTAMVESGLNAVAGVNTIVSPFAAVQVPCTAGVMLGVGESAASGAENAIVTGCEPFTRCAAFAGVTERTCTGGAGLAGWAWCALTDADADDEPVFPEASSQVTPPPMIIRATTATAPPVSSTVRRERGFLGCSACSRFFRAPNKIPLPLLNLPYGPCLFIWSAGAVKRMSRAAQLLPVLHSCDARQARKVRVSLPFLPGHRRLVRTLFWRDPRRPARPSYPNFTELRPKGCGYVACALPQFAVSNGAFACDGGTLDGATNVLPCGPACTASCSALPATNCFQDRNHCVQPLPQVPER